MMPQHYTARDRETGRKSRSGPLATANGYRPADGWGMVIQAWRPGSHPATATIETAQRPAQCSPEPVRSTGNQNTPDGISNDRTIRRPFRTNPPLKILRLQLFPLPCNLHLSAEIGGIG